MPTTPHRPKALVRKIFRATDAQALGLLSRGQLRSTAWRPLFRGVYADRELTVTHQLRCLAVSDYLLPEDAAIAGRSAAALYGAGAPADDDPIEVVAASRFGPLAGVRVHRSPLGVGEMVRRNDRIRVTSPARTGWDLVRWLDLAEAVMLLDILVAKRIVTVTALADFARAKAGSAGWKRLLTAITLIDSAAESPQESRLRVRLVLAGLPRPVAQHVINRDGRFVARVDLAWPALRIAIEYDGAWHADRAQLERDRKRLNQLIGADWIVLHVTAQRMRDDFDGIVQELRAAIRLRSRSLMID